MDSVEEDALDDDDDELSNASVTRTKASGNMKPNTAAIATTTAAHPLPNEVVEHERTNERITVALINPQSYESTLPPPRNDVTTTPNLDEW